MKNHPGTAIKALPSEFRIADWRAWHIFVHHPEVLDRLLVEGIGEEMRNLEKDRPDLAWFYLRYWENGPHIRLRLHGIDDDAFMALGGRLAVIAGKLTSAAPDTPGSYPGDMTVDGWQGSANAAPWFDQGSLIEIVYEPEFRRYGGVLALPPAEQIFGASSKLAISILGQTIDNSAQRRSIAFNLTAAAISVVAGSREELTQFAQTMADYWRGFLSDRAAVEEQIERIFDQSKDQTARLVQCTLQDETASFPNIANKWRMLLVRYRDALEMLAKEDRLISPLTGCIATDASEVEQAIWSIVLSQIHMKNNRLGISPSEEYGFARLLHLSLTEGQS